jgi:tryptophan synthase alpha chain
VNLETTLRAKRAQGRKLLVPYLTGGGTDDWTATIGAIAAAGADAIEIGIPFSDPVMDGPTIQAASEQALRRGTTPLSVLDELATVDAGVPLVIMTYYNLVFRMGEARFAAAAARAGVDGVILPDLPLEESTSWCAAADEHGIETVMLAAPTAPDERLPRVCARARGFVYGVGLLGVTGERQALADSALVIAKRLKAVTDVPVLIGVGISNAAQAAEVSQVADGVVVGSAVMRCVLEGGDPQAVGDLVAGRRAGLDGVSTS